MKCSSCKEDKTDEEFYIRKDRTRGRTYLCKLCYHVSCNTPPRRAKNRERYAQLRREALNVYGGKCECCGESNYEFLSFDHVNGGGTIERRSGIASRRLFKKAIQDFGKGIYRVLCHNCNGALGYYGYCPHQKS